MTERFPVPDNLESYRSWLMLLARMQIGAGYRGKFGPSDVVQQTLLEACQGLAGFRGTTEAELVAWLKVLLARVLAREHRRYAGTAKRDPAREVSLEQQIGESSLRLAQVLAASGTSPSGRVEQHEQEVLLAEMLARLPEDYREVIVLRNLEDLPHEEIARRMNKTAGAVRMLWVRALARLRRELEDR